MLRKLLYLGVATFVVMTISAVAFGEAVAPQARSGNNLLKAQRMEPVQATLTRFIRQSPSRSLWSCWARVSQAWRQ